MQGRRVLAHFALLLVVISRFGSGRALAATPGFTISASDATMPTSDAGSIPFTLASVNGFAGPVVVSCGPANPPTGSFLPQCNYTGSPIATPPYTLTANGTVTGSLNLVAYIPPCSNPCPVKLPRRSRHGRAATLALAGVLLLFGRCFRRRAARWLTPTLIAFATLAGIAGIGACGGGGNTLTPGTFAYTITGSGPTTCTTTAGITTCTTLTENTTVNVTVPAGISTNLPSAAP